MSCGRPVITTPVPGAGELVEHGRTGYIVPIRDVGAILDALKLHFGLTIAQQQAMGQRARNLILHRYDIHEVLGHYYNVVARLRARLS